MRFRHGFGLGEVVAVVAGLGVVGFAGYSMLGGNCALSSCSAGKASSAPALTSVVQTSDEACPLSGCDKGGEVALVALAAEESTCSSQNTCGEAKTCGSELATSTEVPLDNLTIVPVATEGEQGHCSGEKACGAGVEQVSEKTCDKACEKGLD